MAVDERKLYVANLPPNVTEDEIRQVFGLYGDCEEVHINPAKVEGGRRSAFVKFQEPRDAAAAAAVLHDVHVFDGQENTDSNKSSAIRINFAQHKERFTNDRGSSNDNRGSTNDRGGWKNDSKNDSWSKSSDWNKSKSDSGDSYSYNNRGYGDRGGNSWGDRSSGGDRSSYGDRGGNSWGDRSSGGDRSSYGDRQSYNDRQGTASHKKDDAGKLWVGNLPSDITPAGLEQVFGAYGRLAEVSMLPCKSRTGQNCAFVHYAEARSADACLAAIGNGGYQMKPGDGDIKVERPGQRQSKGSDYGGKGGSSYGGGGSDYNKQGNSYGGGSDYGRQGGGGYGGGYGGGGSYGGGGYGNSGGGGKGDFKGGGKSGGGYQRSYNPY